MLILLKQLQAYATVAEARATMLDQLSVLGFNAHSWATASMPYKTVDFCARAVARITPTISAFAEGGWSDLAKGVWLQILSHSRYVNDVHEAVATQGYCKLTANEFGGQPIEAGALVARAGDVTFRNVDGGQLASSGTLSLLFQAETAGASGNVAVGAITELVTALAGVTIANPALSGSTSWITRDGADAERDSELQARNRTKWGTLGRGPASAYVHWAREADPAVKRVFVDDTNPDGPGTFTLYLAGDSGAVSDAVVEKVRKYLYGETDGERRVHPKATVTVLSATAKQVLVSPYALVEKSANTDATKDAVEFAGSEYFKELPIGGTMLTDGGPGAIRVNAMGGRMIGVPGVLNVQLLSQNGQAITRDMQLLRSEVAVPTFLVGLTSA